MPHHDYPVLEKLSGCLIVSCQAAEDEPLYGARPMALMARAAFVGGASGIRANGPDDIIAIGHEVPLAIIGIYKQQHADSDVYITPTFESAQAVVNAGTAIVALDGTPRSRPGGQTLDLLINRIHTELGVPVMADTSCLEDALYAERCGADWVATTLAGYTAHGRPALLGPDLELISILSAQIQIPIIAEGRFREPFQLAEAFARGAYAVVVGGAITRPHEITQRFVANLPRSKRPGRVS